MTESKVASRYAKSLAGLAQEKGLLEQVHQDMLLFANTCETSRDLRVMLRNPIITHDKKSAVLKRLFSGQVNDLTLAFFDIIARKHREAILEPIAQEFHLLYNATMGVENATVITAVPLTPEIRSQFVAEVKTMTGKNQVELKEKLDPDLVGGFVLRIGDRQVDDSVRSRLQDLRALFSQNLYIKEI
ncbi:MAG: ATP synthase F1 subunit delta [Bernardetiaceae bacterium]|jgi:F-type H+-transporting ATPase subunit delta|nr:ATP synthase F1 subunit delta [Bernardetiaceae bacterium]